MTGRALGGTALAFLTILVQQSALAQARGQARLWDAPGPCDRECLIELADDYIAALVAHDPDAVPLAGNIRFTENTVLMRPGEGLWQSLSAGPTEFQVYVPDPVSRMIGYIGMLEADGAPLQFGLRLAIDDAGNITEAEHMVVRNVRETSLVNLRTLRPGLRNDAVIPPGERLPREIMIAIGQTYYDAIELSDGDASLFADDCERRENGMITAGPSGESAFGGPRQGCNAQLDSRAMSYIDSIDLRRVWIADVDTGLVFGISQFRHSMVDKTMDVYDANGALAERAVSFDPFDLPAMHVFKIRGGRIHEIEALGFMTPYMSPSGWNPHLK